MSFRFSRAPSAMPEDISAGSSLISTTTHCHCRPRAQSSCSDLRATAQLRPGYLRADPRDRAAVERAIADAGGLVGTFDKPRFIHFEETLCAHSRSGIVGCTRCLDLCPTGAITPNGNAVTIDPNICAGCGSCAAACPT